MQQCYFIFRIDPSLFLSVLSKRILAVPADWKGQFLGCGLCQTLAAAIVGSPRGEIKSLKREALLLMQVLGHYMTTRHAGTRCVG